MKQGILPPHWGRDKGSCKALLNAPSANHKSTQKWTQVRPHLINNNKESRQMINTNKKLATTRRLGHTQEKSMHE